MNQDNEAPEPAADPHAGQGGSYTLDPATGLRTLVARTAETGTPAQASETQPTEE